MPRGAGSSKWFWDIKIEKSGNVHDIMANHANQSKRPPQAEILFFGAWKTYFQAIFSCFCVSKSQNFRRRAAKFVSKPLIIFYMWNVEFYKTSNVEFYISGVENNKYAPGRP